jgi:hypothetical protein
MVAGLVRSKSCAGAPDALLTSKSHGRGTHRSMKKHLVIVIFLLGCSEAPEIESAEEAQPRNHADPSVVQCVEQCDCFDDNACTTDVCLNGSCLNEPTNGYCGSTIGVCRGASCCTSEYTCFRAYDNDSACRLHALSCAASPDGAPCALDASWEGVCRSGLCCWSCVDEAPGGGVCPFETPDGALVTGQCVTGRCFQSWDYDLQPWVCR